MVYEFLLYLDNDKRNPSPETVAGPERIDYPFEIRRDQEIEYQFQEHLGLFQVEKVTLRIVSYGTGEMIKGLVYLRPLYLEAETIVKELKKYEENLR